ncbi:MAG: SDR family NAD(P)-dependent oxidoreductase [Acetobacteraceae bacterium]|nr:SDR family NAD(P)-dependent oxidoreductase [Acetobacteraceae bacterium]
MDLLGKVAIITGADSGIGQATAEALATRGADVAIDYHTDADGAAETKRRVEAAGRRANVAQADVGDPASIQALFDGAVEALGLPDLLVANAGVGMSGMPVAEMADGKLEQVLRTDLMGPLFCARAFVRLRKQAGGGGRLVIIGSVAGHLPTPASAPYGMAKAGVNSLVRSLSVEVAPDRINVNAIAPGLIATPMTQKRLDDPAEREKSMQAIPWRRPGKPEEIAGLAAFLLSDAGDYVTGQTWVMDGGLTMNWGGA